MCILTSFTAGFYSPLNVLPCSILLNFSQSSFISNARLITKVSTGDFSGFFHRVHFFAHEKFGKLLDFVHVTERFLDPSKRPLLTPFHCLRLVNWPNGSLIIILPKRNRAHAQKYLWSISWRLHVRASTPLSSLPTVHQLHMSASILRGNETRGLEEQTIWIRKASTGR